MKRILALIDFSEVTPCVIRLARDLALAINTELVLMNVVGSKSDFIDDETQEDISVHARCLRSRQRELQILGLELRKEGVNITTRVVESPRNGAGATILEWVARLAPDLIVMGSHGHGRLHQLLCGSVADTVLRKSACPVTIVPRPRGQNTPGRECSTPEGTQNAEADVRKPQIQSSAFEIGASAL